MSVHVPSEPVTSDDVTSLLTAVFPPGLIAPLAPGPVADQALAPRVARYARCADSGLDPDEWFPVGIEPGSARQKAAAAIAVCAGCLVHRFRQAVAAPGGGRIVWAFGCGDLGPRGSRVDLPGGAGRLLHIQLI